MLTVAFVRRRGRRDRVYVTREDGTSSSWDFPSYGDALPHDLCHLVVESELGLTDGFWGLIDQGVDVGLVNNQAALMRDNRPLAEHAGFDLSGLLEAEAAVAVLAGPVNGVGDVNERPVGAEPEAINTIRDRLRQLSEQWRRLDDGTAMTLQYRGTSA